MEDGQSRNGHVQEGYQDNEHKHSLASVVHESQEETSIHKAESDPRYIV